MATPFPSDAWIKELMTVANNSPAYQEAAQKWEGDLCFVIQTGNGPDKYLYMDLWHGRCRSAEELATTTAKSAEFEIAAPIATWRKVLEGKIDPIQGLVSRQLKLKGNMLKIMKAPRAALELVNCAKTINTAWG